MNGKGCPEPRGRKCYLAEVGTGMGDLQFERVVMIVIGVGMKVIHDVFADFEQGG